MLGVLLALSCVPALLLGLAIGHAARSRWDGLMPRWLPSAALAPGLLLIAWHFRRVSDFIAPVATALASSGAVAELQMLSLVLPFAVVVVWGLAILLVRRFPLCALAFPLAATQVYLFGIAQAAPQVRQVIGAQSEWLSFLLASQIPVTLAVGGFLWSALGRAGVAAPWPLRER